MPHSVWLARTIAADGRWLRVELQHLELVRERREMLDGLLDENAEQHRRKRDVADGDFVGLGVAGFELSDTACVDWRDVADRDFIDGAERHDPAISGSGGGHRRGDSAPARMRSCRRPRRPTSGNSIIGIVQ